jgi:uncharacterized protein (TIGR04255 family)
LSVQAKGMVRDLMLFPEFERVIYEKNPLAEVICQVRFPRILRIDTELPTLFQDRVRPTYPHFDQSPVVELGPLPPELSRLAGLGKVLGVGQQKYEFASTDRTSRVSLTSQFLAFSTSVYRRWEDFKGQLVGPLNALIECYNPAFFTRIGLRYQDVIRRSCLGLNEVGWHDLLQDHVLGELAKPGFEKAALHVARDLLLQLDDLGDRVRVQHGFARTGEDPETCYLIDGDFYFETQTERDDATTVLDRLNKESGRLFRWCIKDRLHAAMDPRPA